MGTAKNGALLLTKNGVQNALYLCVARAPSAQVSQKWIHTPCSFVVSSWHQLQFTVIISIIVPAEISVNAKPATAFIKTSPSSSTSKVITSTFPPASSATDISTSTAATGLFLKSITLPQPTPKLSIFTQIHAHNSDMRARQSFRLSRDSCCKSRRILSRAFSENHEWPGSQEIRPAKFVPYWLQDLVSTQQARLDYRFQRPRTEHPQLPTKARFDRGCHSSLGQMRWVRHNCDEK